MKLSREVKLGIIECNLDSLRVGEDSLIEVDNETFDMGMEYLLESERYEDCSLMRDNKKKFVSDHKIYEIEVPIKGEIKKIRKVWKWIKKKN